MCKALGSIPRTTQNHYKLQKKSKTSTGDIKVESGGPYLLD
jgi:hypothetical protein